MKSYTHQLSEVSEKALSSAIGKNVGFMFPEAWLNVTTEGVVTSSVSISLDPKSYLIIENVWADTPIAALDYYFFSASLSDKPKDITVTEHTGHGWLHHRASTIDTWSPTVVNRIGIYEFSESFEDESVNYDSAILISYEAGQILLSAEQSISGYIEINYKREAIKENLEQMRLRKEIY